MQALDCSKLLANDPPTTEAFVDCIRRYVRRYFKRDSQIHDVTQATMIDLLAKLRDGPPPPTPEQVRQCVINCANNAVKREITRSRRPAVSFESHLHLRPTPTQSTVLNARQEIAWVDEQLRRGSDLTREIVLAAAQGETHREVADTLGTTPGGVRTTLSRARAQLRETTTAREKLRYLQWLAQHAGHGQPSLFRPKRSSSSSH